MPFIFIRSPFMWIAKSSLSSWYFIYRSRAEYGAFLDFPLAHSNRYFLFYFSFAFLPLG